MAASPAALVRMKAVAASGAAPQAEIWMILALGPVALACARAAMAVWWMASSESPPPSCRAPAQLMMASTPVSREAQASGVVRAARSWAMVVDRPEVASSADWERPRPVMV